MMMIDRRLYREQPDFVRENVKKQGHDVDVDEIVRLDEKWRGLKKEGDDLRRERNELTEDIRKSKEKGADAEELIEESKKLKDRIQEVEREQKEVESELEDLLLRVPNLYTEGVPEGEGEEDNIELRREFWDNRADSETVDPHWEIGEKLQLIDEERGAKVAGSNYYFMKGDGARLEKALIEFMIDIHEEQDYTLLHPPLVVNTECLKTTGQYPYFVETEGAYQVEDDDLWLSPTSEIAIVNMHREEILNDEDLPLKYQAASSNFRKEAGQHGIKTRGIARVHQFQKVEMINFAKPDRSYEVLEQMRNEAEEVLKRLELPYRILDICSADLPFSSAKTYDIEAWSPAREDWLEVSSVSNCEGFQARRGNIRYRPEPHDETEYIHVLNGTGLGIPRTIISLLENYQIGGGRVRVPDPLQEYMGGQKVIEGHQPVGESTRS